MRHRDDLCACKEPITPDWLAAQRFQIEIGWQRYAAARQLAPLYDPKLERVKK